MGSFQVIKNQADWDVWGWRIIDFRDDIQVFSLSIERMLVLTIEIEEEWIWEQKMWVLGLVTLSIWCLWNIQGFFGFMDFLFRRDIQVGGGILSFIVVIDIMKVAFFWDRQWEWGVQWVEYRGSKRFCLVEKGFSFRQFFRFYRNQYRVLYVQGFFLEEF